MNAVRTSVSRGTGFPVLESVGTFMSNAQTSLAKRTNCATSASQSIYLGRGWITHECVPGEPLTWTNLSAETETVLLFAASFGVLLGVEFCAKAIPDVAFWHEILRLFVDVFIHVHCPMLR